MKRIAAALFALGLMLGCANTSQASILQFGADLNGAQEVPAKVTPAFGSAYLEYDTDTNVLTVTSLSFTGMLAPLVAGHIHGPAAVGVNAGVVFDLGGSLPIGSTSGSLIGTPSFILTAAQETTLLSELYYINLHTTLHPGGEIRGQVVPVPEPASLVLLSFSVAGALGYTWCKRSRFS